MTRLLFGLMTLVQPVVAPPDVVRGTVTRPDGRVVAGARIVVECGPHRAEARSGPDGGFELPTASNIVCTLRVTEGAFDKGVQLDIQADADAPVTVVLPEAADPVRPLRRLFVVEDAPPRKATPAPSRWNVKSISSWTGLEPPAHPDGQPSWSTGVSFEAEGPLGVRLRGETTARRQTGHTTLLDDITGTRPLGASGWGSLYDPSGSATSWPVRLGLERTFRVGGADVTLFGEGFKTFQRDTASDAVPTIAGAAQRSLRTGSAARVGVKIGF